MIYAAAAKQVYNNAVSSFEAFQRGTGRLLDACGLVHRREGACRHALVLCEVLQSFLPWSENGQTQVSIYTALQKNQFQEQQCKAGISSSEMR